MPTNSFTSIPRSAMAGLIAVDFTCISCLNVQLFQAIMERFNSVNGYRGVSLLGPAEPIVLGLFFGNWDWYSNLK